MIPDEAVEAAARAICVAASLTKWEGHGPLTHDVYRIHARSALEAAAPHMPSDLEVFARMFEGFVGNLRENNIDNDPVLVGEINAYTFAARQLRAAINDEDQP